MGRDAESFLSEVRKETRTCAINICVQYRTQNFIQSNRKKKDKKDTCLNTIMILIGYMKSTMKPIPNNRTLLFEENGMCLWYVIVSKLVTKLFDVASYNVSQPILC